MTILSTGMKHRSIKFMLPNQPKEHILTLITLIFVYSLQSKEMVEKEKLLNVSEPNDLFHITRSAK